MPEVKLQTQETEETYFYELLTERGLEDAERVLQEPFSCLVKKMPEVETQETPETVETKETEETQETEETNFYELLTERGIDDAERVLQEPFSSLVKQMPEVKLETVETKETVETQETEETKESEETMETEKTKEVEETEETYS